MENVCVGGRQECLIVQTSSQDGITESHGDFGSSVGGGVMDESGIGRVEAQAAFVGVERTYKRRRHPPLPLLHCLAPAPREAAVSAEAAFPGGQPQGSAAGPALQFFVKSEILVTHGRLNRPSHFPPPLIKHRLLLLQHIPHHICKRHHHRRIQVTLMGPLEQHIIHL